MPSAHKQITKKHGDDKNSHNLFNHTTEKIIL